MSGSYFQAIGQHIQQEDPPLERIIVQLKSQQHEIVFAAGRFLRADSTMSPAEQRLQEIIERSREIAHEAAALVLHAAISAIPGVGKPVTREQTDKILHWFMDEQNDQILKLEGQIANLDHALTEKQNLIDGLEHAIRVAAGARR